MGFADRRWLQSVIPVMGGGVLDLIRMANWKTLLLCRGARLVTTIHLHPVRGRLVESPVGMLGLQHREDGETL
jgi:hypothetical protein